MSLPAKRTQKRVRVLFLCTHNSARSQIAEAILRHKGGQAVEVFSAGTEVTRVHPDALAVLRARGIETSGLSSKHLAQFVDAPFDYVITVCDNARESCPYFPHAGARLHWSFPDPTAAGDLAARAQAFVAVFEGLAVRIKGLLGEIEAMGK